jgi:hypothetical protein
VEITKENGEAAFPQQIALDYQVVSRVAPGGYPGAMRLNLVMVVKLATQGEGYRRIGATAEIEIFEGGDYVMETMIAQIANEWKALVQKAREQRQKMQEAAKNAPRIVRPGAPMLSKDAIEKIKRGD